MKTDHFKSLFARMLATYLTVILCLLLLMGITVTSMFKSQYIREEENALRHEGEKINTIVVTDYADDKKRQSAIDRLTTVARQYDALIQVIDFRGNPHSFMDETQTILKWELCDEAGNAYFGPEEQAVWCLPGISVWLQSPLCFENIRLSAWKEPARSAKALTQDGVLAWNAFREVTGMSTLTLLRPIIGEEGQEGLLLIHFDMSAVNDSIKQVYLDVLLTAFVAVVAAILAVYYITTRITKPIVDMNATVRRYSKGNFDLRLQAGGTDEVAQLAQSFNVMADELNDLEQTRRSFVANVSHELRSPLTSMRGFLEAMQDGTIPPDERGKYMDVVISETRRMTDMVNDLLDLARIESGQTTLNLTVFDLNELTRRTLITFETRVNEKNLAVDLEVPSAPCYVEADSVQIVQVLRNLIDNALKYSPEKGTLSIKIAVMGRKSATVTVRDEGNGIPTEDIPRVFDRFYKVEKAHTPTLQSGTGLGLALVKRIVDQHDENIWVESSEGHGTAFTFTLKRAPEAPRPKRPQELQHAAGERNLIGGEK